MSVAKRFASISKKKPNLLFVELNDLAPETVLSIAALFPEGHVVDGCIIGGPPQVDGYSPSIYLSGEHAHELDFLKNTCGLDVRIISNNIGDASGLKMCYAPMFKSVTAIGIQACVTAKRLGLNEIFLDELKRSLPDVSDMLRSLVPGIAPRASRWVGEMGEISRSSSSPSSPLGLWLRGSCPARSNSDNPIFSNVLAAGSGIVLTRPPPAQLEGRGPLKGGPSQSDFVGNARGVLVSVRLLHALCCSCTACAVLVTYGPCGT